MSDAWLLAVASLVSFCGMAWLALAMREHWLQVRGEAAPSGSGVALLRLAGALALAVSLRLCLWADHPSIASLVWVMLLTAAALSVAVMLSWRPRWLRWLVPLPRRS